jgi:secreted trypsin-like serine protease
VIGGKLVPDGAFPLQVSLGVASIPDSYRAHFCGGSVYSDRWIITAAHCAQRLTSSMVFITAGTNHLREDTPRQEISRIIVHKDFVTRTFDGDTCRRSLDNDIALIGLRDPLPLGSNIRPVALLTVTTSGAP